MLRLGMRIVRNPWRAPFFPHVVGILENPYPQPDWLDWVHAEDQPEPALGG
jgi:hypothetical protein